MTAWAVVKIGAIVFLAAGSIGLAAVEASFYLLRRRRLGHLASDDPSAAAINSFLEDPPKLLMPAHVGTYTAHVGMTLVLTSLLFEWFELAAALPIVFLTMVVYLLLLRLMLPYALVRQEPEQALLRLAVIFVPYARLTSPLVLWLRRVVTPASAVEDERDSTHPALPPPPALDVDEARVVDSVERFSRTLVREVMTPRPDIEAITSTATVAELRELMRESKYSRIPVYRDKLDDVIGVVSVRDVLEYDGDLDQPLEGLSRPVFLVPETKKIAELLRELQREHLTLAVVLDEYGGTAGVVTVEDIVEELVGEIKDEYDVETEPIVLEPDGSVLVAGRTSLERLEQTLEATLTEDDVDTVGGLATAVFGRVPRVGEECEYRGYSLEVVEAERKRVNRIRFRRRDPAPEE